MLVVGDDELFILSMSPTLFYAFSASQQALYVFCGCSAKDVYTRCNSIGNGLGKLVPLPTNKLHGLWTSAPTSVHYFVANGTFTDFLQSILPHERDYRRISGITFTLIETSSGQRFAEQWMGQTKRLLLALSQSIPYDVVVENAAHLIRISPLSLSAVKVQVNCSLTDSEALSRVMHLTRGNSLELSMNTLHRDHLDALTRLPLSSLKAPYNSCHDIIPAMSVLPNLRTLTLFSSTNAVNLRTPNPPSYQAFPSLTELNLLMPPENALQVLQGTCTAALQSLYLEFPALSRPSRHTGLRELGSFLSQRCPFLTKLRIRVHGLHSSEDPSWSADVLAFQTLRNLQTFAFEHPLPLCLTSTQVRTLLQAWPHATSIMLNPRAPPTTGRLSHMNVLMTLRYYFPPTLRHFGLSLDPETSIGSYFAGQHYPVSCPLETLDIGTCRITDEFRVLSSIHSLFPALRRTDHGQRV